VILYHQLAFADRPDRRATICKERTGKRASAILIRKHNNPRVKKSQEGRVRLDIINQEPPSTSDLK